MKVRGVVAFLLIVFVADQTFATPFTYQGRLIRASMPADGTFDLELRLFDALADGNMVGAVQTFSAVVVAGGFFTVEPDFGDPGFGQQPLWLEVAVRDATIGGDFVTLAPRTRLNAVPFAVRSQMIDPGAIDPESGADGEILTLQDGAVAFAPPALALSRQLGARLGQRVRIPDHFDDALATHTCDPGIDITLIAPDSTRFPASALYVTEGISQLPDLWIAFETGGVLSPFSFLNQFASLELATASGTTLLGGLTFEAHVDDLSGGQRRHVLRLRPDWAGMLLTSDYAIFQERQVPQIVAAVLGSFGLTANTALGGSYTVRPYEVMYNETPLAFIERLLARNGIFYVFEYGSAATSAMLADDNATLDSTLTLPYGGPDLHDTGMAYISRFSDSTRLFTSNVTSRAYDPERPSTRIESTVLTGGNGGEDYRFLGDVTGADELTQRSSARAQALSTAARLNHGTSNATGLRAGTRLTVTDAEDAFDGEYIVTRISHLALRNTRAGCMHYANAFEALPSAVDFSPPQYLEPTIDSVLSAVVVGPVGETTFTDGQGRVKVQFLWDRDGTFDEASSAFIRAMVPTGATTFTAPAVGTEVLVAFIQGDPDRPVVVGSLFNGENPPQ